MLNVYIPQEINFCSLTSFVLDQIHEGFLQIGNTQVPRYSNHSDIALVPNVIFYDNPQVNIL